MDISVTADETLSSGDVEVTIDFKVEKTWLEHNDINKENIVLMRYSEGEWITLDTTVTDENSTHVFFEATTNATSTFAITALSTKDADGKEKSDDGIPWFMIIGAVAAVMVLLIVFLFKTGYLYIEETDVNKKDTKTTEKKTKKKSKNKK